MVRITVGLPGSGKTRWARAEIARHLDARGDPAALVRVSRDDLRRMMTNSYGAPIREFEEMVTLARDAAIIHWVHAGASVIVDECSLNPAYFRTLTGWLENTLSVRWQSVGFTDVPLEICIARDVQRPESERVGEAVIRGMWERYLAPVRP